MARLAPASPSLESHKRRRNRTRRRGLILSVRQPYHGLMHTNNHAFMLAHPRTGRQAGLRVHASPRACAHESMCASVRARIRTRALQRTPPPPPTWASISPRSNNKSTQLIKHPITTKQTQSQTQQINKASLQGQGLGRRHGRGDVEGRRTLPTSPPPRGTGETERRVGRRL